MVFADCAQELPKDKRPLRVIVGCAAYACFVVQLQSSRKTKIACKLRRVDKAQRTDLEAIVRGLTSALAKAPNAEARLRMLMVDWLRAIPRRSASRCAWRSVPA